MVKNWCGLLNHGTLKFTKFKTELMKLADFFACWYKLSEVKSHVANYWKDMVKNRQGLLDHGTLKSSVSHKWFDQLSRLIDWFLHGDSNGMILGWSVNLLSIFNIQMLVIHCSCLRLLFFSYPSDFYLGSFNNFLYGRLSNINHFSRVCFILLTTSYRFWLFVYATMSNFEPSV